MDWDQIVIGIVMSVRPSRRGIISTTTDPQSANCRLVSLNGL